MSDTVKIGDIASLKTGPFGTQFSAKEYTDWGIPVINVKNIGYGQIIEDDLEFVSEQTRDRLCEHILHTGDIVFGRKGSVDRHAYISEKYDGWVQGSDCIRLRFQSGINTRYISHFLKLDHIKKQINCASVGSTMASLNTDILKSIEVLLPAIGVQSDVEKVLSTIEEKMEVNSAICAELESMAKTIYDYWFTQFDFPDANSNPYRSSGGAMEWNEQLKREIPKGWDVGNLGSMGTVTSGGTPSTKSSAYYSSNGIAWITPNDLSGKEHKLFFSHGERDITREGLNNSSAVLMPKGTVLFSSRAPIGYIAIAENEVCSNQGFKSIVPNKGYGSFFVYYTVKVHTPAIAKQGVGTTFKEISRDTMERFQIVLPPPSIANKFESILNAAFEQRRILEHENDELTKLRNWLLPMLMNGQATVGD